MPVGEGVEAIGVPLSRQPRRLAWLHIAAQLTDGFLADACQLTQPYEASIWDSVGFLSAFVAALRVEPVANEGAETVV